MKQLKIKKNTKKTVQLNKEAVSLKVKTNLKAGNWDWLWHWPKKEDQE